MNPAAERVVRAPGRVNLIGDHTDYTGGLVLPMAVDRWTEIRGIAGGTTVRLTSADDPAPVELPLRVDDPARVEPAWGRYVAGIVSELRPDQGFEGRATTTIPIGGGMSSSHALEVAVALALGFDGGVPELVLLTQRAEQRASGVPTGIMDQLSIAAGVAGHALLIDCSSMAVEPVPLPDGIDVVVRSVAPRTLVGSEYAARVAECAAAEREIGPLREATADDVAGIHDPVVRRRAAHVVGENARVRAAAEALRAGDVRGFGELMVASHASLRELYDTSTDEMDAAVDALVATPGVLGARMTGGGFGGCVVALCEHGAPVEGWRVRAVGGAHVVEPGSPA